jgi:hypothetical protein
MMKHTIISYVIIVIIVGYLLVTTVWSVTMSAEVNNIVMVTEERSHPPSFDLRRVGIQSKR